MSNKLTKALDTCIARIGRGDSVEQCLSEYPEIEDELGQLLHIFTLISESPKVVPSEDFRRRSKAQLMAHIQQPDTTERKQSKQAAGDKQSIWQTILSPRRVAIPVIGVVVLVIASILFSNIFGLWSPAPVLAQPCVLSTLSGSVALKETGSDAWISGTDGVILDSGSLIKTDSDSHALLTFFDGSTMKLEPEAAIEIKEIEYSKQQATGITVKQLSGVTWSHVSKSPEPGSHFRVETPSAEIAVQGTSFTVEVDKSGSTKVAATEGSVTVSAQKRKIHLLANQQTEVNAGLVPTLPTVRGEALSKLLITVELPGVGSVRDPNSASTGCFPDGVSFNQIKESLSELLPDGSQLITIPQPVSGRYTLTIRNTGAQSVRLDIKAVSEGEVVFEHQDKIGGTGDGDRIMHLNITVEGGKIISGEIVDVEPLVNQVPEKVVVTELAVERAAPLKSAIEEAGKQPVEPSEEATPSRPDDLSENRTPDKQDSIREIITKEESPKSAQSEEIIRTDKPRLEDKKQDDELIKEKPEDSEAGTEADVTDRPVTDNTTRIDRPIQDNGLTKEKLEEGEAATEADVTDKPFTDNVSDDGLIKEEPEEGEAGAEADVTDKPATDNVSDDSLIKEEPEGSEAGTEADVTDRLGTDNAID
jgi:hypothetical protein